MPPFVRNTAFVPATLLCSSLAFQPPDELAKTLKLVKEAGITVVSLPLVNQWTQVRAAIHVSCHAAANPTALAFSGLFSSGAECCWQVFLPFKSSDITVQQ